MRSTQGKTHGTQGKTHGDYDYEAMEVAGRELDMPKVSIEEDPAAWYAFAQRCFLDGRGDLARRALRALEGDEALPPAAPDGSARQVFRPPSPTEKMCHERLDIVSKLT